MSPLFVKLSTTYFFYCGAIGLIVPFLSVYLGKKGFSSLEIGEIIAVFTATKIVGPSLWASFADQSGKQLFIIRAGSLLTIFSFCLLLFFDAYWPISFSLALFGLFWTSILPQLEAMTSASIKGSAKIYARIRLWGSIGFIVIAIIAGEALSRYQEDAFIWIGLILLIGMSLTSLLLKQPKTFQSKSIITASIKEKILSKNFICFFIGGMLLQISFGPFYNFFAFYLNDLNYPSYAVGLLLGLAVFAEVVLFIYIGFFTRRFSTKFLLVASLFFTALRWYLMAEFGDVVTVMILTQLIHAFSYGLFHSSAMQFLKQHFTKKQQNRGQALYVGGVFGVGGAIGAYMAGFVWLDGAGAVQSYYLAAGLALLAALITLPIKVTR